MGGTVADVAETEHKRGSAELMGSRLEFETLISDLSSRFINLPAGEVDREIEDAQRRVCELLGVDLVGAVGGDGDRKVSPSSSPTSTARARTCCLPCAG